MLCQADADGNGCLDYGEFVTLSVHLKKIGNDEHLHKAFGYFDRNKSGYIEIDELRESLADDLGQNHEEVINAIIRDVDTDKVCGSSPTSWQIFSCFCFSSF
jgi:calcium-dependent protein kinase